MSTQQSRTPVDLFVGWPNPGLLLPEGLRNACHTTLSDAKIWPPALGYGPDEGDLSLRQEIAKWLTRFYAPKEPIPTDRICITGGASQNLACLLQTFTDPVYTRNVWMVSPTYYLACRIFEDSGFAGRLRGVPEDEEGIEIDLLAKGLQLSESKAQEEGNLHPKFKRPRPWRKIYKQVIYAVPTFANPSGRSMSLARRQALVQLARKYDALIITDDVYDMLQWPSSPNSPKFNPERAYIPRIVDIDRYLEGGPVDDYGNAVSNGTFSKLIGPGCRTGWAEGTEKLAFGLSQTGSSRSGGCPSHLAAVFIQNLLATSALQQHIHDVLRPGYARRYRLLMESIQEHLLPLGVTTSQVDPNIAGGYFIWLNLPRSLSADSVTKKALHEEGLKIGDGALFRVQGDKGENDTSFESDIRLCFAWAEEELLQEGVRRLANVIKRALAEGSKHGTK